eukprot:3244925-Rhodomonas_salina.1
MEANIPARADALLSGNVRPAATPRSCASPPRSHGTQSSPRTPPARCPHVITAPTHPPPPRDHCSQRTSAGHALLRDNPVRAVR